jgi:hypothetical protein
LDITPEENQLMREGEEKIYREEVIKFRTLQKIFFVMYCAR